MQSVLEPNKSEARRLVFKAGRSRVSRAVETPTAAGLTAVRWLRPGEDPSDPEGRVPYAEVMEVILDGCAAHRHWYNDPLWDQGPEARRSFASAYIADAYVNGIVWDIWHGDAVCGIFILNRVERGQDAYAHFLFFDHELRNKRELCRTMMRQTFDDTKLNLHSLRVEVPDHMGNLAGFLRKALGFKFEAERRLPDPALAKKASQRHHARLYLDKWQNVLLLSVTREEFLLYVRTQRNTRTSLDGPDRSTRSPDEPVSPSTPPESAASLPEHLAD